MNLENYTIISSARNKISPVQSVKKSYRQRTNKPSHIIQVTVLFITAVGNVTRLLSVIVPQANDGVRSGVLLQLGLLVFVVLVSILFAYYTEYHNVPIGVI